MGRNIVKAKQMCIRDRYYYSKKHEPIISREDFDKVQALIKQRSKYFGNTEFKQYPLSMKVFCGNCGKLFKRIKIRGKIYWVCRTHNNRAKDCTHKAIVQELIYASFIRLYNKMYFNYKEILLPLHTALQNLKLRKFSGQAQVMEVRKEIAKLREQSHVLARLKTKGFLDEAKSVSYTHLKLCCALKAERSFFMLIFKWQCFVAGYP